MSDIYSRYLHLLAADGTPPDQGPFEEVLAQLHTDVKREIRRRGLWDLPPSYLGGAENRWDGDALESLVHEVYVYVFHERVRDLKRQLEVKKKGNVDGLVVLNIRYCLTDLQRKADPIGYRVFELAKAATLHGIDEGSVHVLEGSEKVRNDTVLGLRRRASPEEACAHLGEAIGSRYDALLLEMIQARKRAVPKVVEKLTGALVDLRDAGVTAFRFKDLVDLLKLKVRQSWEGAWTHEGDFGVEEGDDGRRVLVPVVAPRLPDDDGALDEWLRCVARWIDQLPRDRAVVWSLWKLLRSFTVDADPDGPDAETPKRLSYRKLGALLKIDRERVPVVLRTIRHVVERCRSPEGDSAAQPTPFTKNHSNDLRPQPGVQRREAS
jgi:hypothetical protein